jgi:hypothetical protein
MTAKLREVEMEKTLRLSRRRDLLIKTSAISFFCTLMLAMAAPFAMEQSAHTPRPIFVPYKERIVVEPPLAEERVELGLLQE